MPRSDAKSKGCLGFLTVVEHPEQGFFGGYLVLNMAGRPLEFHCTAPVRPNRAQQILYGPTLEPYLFGEQIGQTLVSKSKAEPLLVCTDLEAALAVRDYVAVPVALVLAAEEPPPSECEPGPNAGAVAAADTLRIDIAHRGPRVTPFRLGRNRLAVQVTSAGDRELVTQHLGSYADAFDLAEPFQRIREAIEEARRGGQST